MLEWDDVSPRTPRTLPRAEVPGPKNAQTLQAYIETAWRNGVDCATTDLAHAGVTFIRLLRGELEPNDIELMLGAVALQLGNAAMFAGFEHDDIMTVQRALFENYAMEIEPDPKSTDYLQFVMFGFAENIGLELDFGVE